MINSSKRPKRPAIDDSKIGTNPLAGIDFKVLLKKQTDHNALIKSESGILVPKEYSAERDAFTKIYTQHQHRELIAQLPDASLRLYMWIAYELEPGRDYLWINKQRYMQENAIKAVNTYKKAITGMMAKNIITPTIYKDVFWINPRLFFAGSRVNKYPQNIEYV